MHLLLVFHVQLTFNSQYIWMAEKRLIFEELNGNYSYCFVLLCFFINIFKRYILNECMAYYRDISGPSHFYQYVIFFFNFCFHSIINQSFSILSLSCVCVINFNIFQFSYLSFLSYHCPLNLPYSWYNTFSSLSVIDHQIFILYIYGKFLITF